jgi:hypothetical protein
MRVSSARKHLDMAFEMHGQVHICIVQLCWPTTEDRVLRQSTEGLTEPMTRARDTLAQPSLQDTDTNATP